MSDEVIPLCKYLASLPAFSVIDVKKAMRIRDNLDRNRKNSPLIQAKNAVIVRTDKLKNIKGMLNKMSEIIEEKIKDKYGS